MGILVFHERRSQPPGEYAMAPDGKMYKVGSPKAKEIPVPSADKYSQYDSVLLKPLERLKSEERVGLAKDLLLLLTHDEVLALLMTPAVREMFASYSGPNKQ